MRLPVLGAKRLWLLVLPVIVIGASRVETELFSNVTEAAGIHWKHFSGASDDRFLIEAMGGGVGFLDFDGDGLLDIFFVTGGQTPTTRSARPPLNALYHNLGNGKFEDVASKAGVASLPFYGMGVAAADFDNDGLTDLFVTGYPASALLHNNGNGTFTDVTARAHVQNQGRWGASAASFDYDRDGLLDLFVCNYVKFSFEDRKRCEYAGKATYCAQTAYEGDAPTLYHNNGDGTFTDVSEQAGLRTLAGRALGVVSIDMNDDGWPDLVVARDASPNLLLRNRHNGTFMDAAVDAEIAYNADGTARAGMGVDAGDVNGDGMPDLVFTNFNDENHSLYLNRGTFPFEEYTIPSGLARFTRRYVGWGTHFADYDNDGILDLLIANGHINQVIEQTRKNVPYKEPPLLLRNNRTGVYTNMEKTAGSVFQTGYIARGLAVGDYDNDGGVDAVLTRIDEGPILLHNNTGAKRSWIGVQLQGTRSNRDAIGAKVTLQAGKQKLVRWVTGGSSYLSSHDKRLLFGLGDLPALEPVTLEIRWPNGSIQTVSGLETNRYHRIAEPR
jgi:hypothetical protein